MSENVTNEWKQTKKTTVGFKVVTHKHNVFKQYANIFCNRQYKIQIQKNTGDSQNNLVRMLRKCNLCLVHYQYIMQTQYPQQKEGQSNSLLKKTEIKEQYPDDNYTEEEVYEARQKRTRMTT